MKKHGFRSIFSLLLAVMMVCSMLPTAAFAEGNVEEQPVVVETYTVTYTDGMGGAAFAEQKTEGLLYGDPTPAFAGDPALDGYTFTGWDKEIAETVTESVTYTAQWQAVPADVQPEAQSDVQPEADGNGEIDNYMGGPGHPGGGDWHPGGPGDHGPHPDDPKPNKKLQISLYVNDGQSQDFLKTVNIDRNSESGFAHSIAPLSDVAQGNSGKYGEVTSVTGDWTPNGSANEGDTVTWGHDAESGYVVYNVAPQAASSTVVLHPSVGSTVTGVKVKVGDKIDGHPITSISGYDIIVDLGKYNVNNDTFRLPYAKDIWEGVDNNKVDYISWAGSGSNRRSEGASALLANGENTAYYYFKGAPVLPTFTLNYNANGGTGAPARQTYKATSEYEKSHTFTISSQTPTHEGYEFLGWSTDSNATSASYQPGGSIVVTGTTTLYAVWKNRTFILKFDANSGTDAPGDLSQTSNNFSVTFNIPEQEPTREGYTFKGWQSQGKLSNEIYKYGSSLSTCAVSIYDTDAVVHEGNTHTRTLKAVWEEDAPKAPGKPTVDDLTGLEGSVKVRCTTKPKTHTAASFGLIEGTYTIGDVRGNETDGYTCGITVTADKYVEKYNTDFGPHTLTGDSIKTLQLYYTDGKWTALDGTTPVVFEVVCPTAPTDMPTEDDIKAKLGKIQVKCVTEGSGHAVKEYDTSVGGYTAVTMQDKDGKPIYTVTITVPAQRYIEKYNEETGKTHQLASGEAAEKTVVLKYADKQWTLVKGTLPVSFNVTCGETKPAAPNADQVDSQLNVKVNCANMSAAHQKDMAAFVYETLLPGSFSIGEVTGDALSGYKCEITVQIAQYLQDFNTRSNATHTPTDGTEKSVTLYYLGGGWSVGTGSGMVEFTVTCETVPAQKYTVTYTDGVDGVEVFKDQVYADLTAGTATPAFNGTPTRVGYVFAGWNPAVAATVTGNATYAATWKVDSNNNGKPDDEELRYTVTYVDGANGKAFASQVYTGLLSGTATPKFNGTPLRSGYVFIGWSPVWSGTVTGNVTYTATWSTVTGGLDKVPKTGDNGLTLALSALVLFSFCGATACVISTKKRG